jgi:hypothetical protein
MLTLSHTRTALGLTFVGLAAAAAGNTASGANLANVNLTSGLKAYWNFDETGGTTVFDTAPGGVADNGNFATNAAQVPTRISTGVLGGALSFDGGDAVAIAKSTDLDIGAKQLTISLWVNAASFPASGANRSIYDSLNDQYVVYQDGTNKELRFKVTTGNGAARPGIPMASIANNTWVHVLGVYDGTAAGGTGTASIYLNGVLADTHTGDDTSHAGLNTNVNPGQIAGIGAQPTSATTNPPDTFTTPFSGAVDEIAVWNRVLNADEIAYLYNGGAGSAVVAVPEPGSLAALALGVLPLLGRRGRRGR